MESSFSIYNNVGSINFETPHIQEEDEAAEDERIKEIELQDLLKDAFDDLIDDDEDEGSIQHDSPTKNSIHSDIDKSSINSDPHFPYQNFNPQQNNSNSPGKEAVHPPFNVFQKQHSITEETNDKFQQMDYEPCNGDSSLDFGSSSQENSHMDQAVNKEWEDQYYVDQWGDGQSYDQLQSGLLDINYVNRLQQQQVQQKMTNGIHCGDSNEKVAYHTEDGVQDIIEYKKQALNDNEKFQNQLVSAGGESGDQIELQRLQIVSNAKGSEIQRLKRNLENLQENMNDQMIAMNNEREKYAADMQASQRELATAKGAISKLEGQLRASDVQLSSITSTRDEVVHKLQVAESAIESLQVQIEELHKSENLNRARQNHATMLQSLSEKHNKEVYLLKTEITDIKDQLQTKDTEIGKLRGKLNKLSHECDEIKTDKAETVNRLLKALEESQDECQRLVREVNKPPLQTTNHSNDEIVLGLKEELATTRKELDLYVSAARHGILRQDGVPDLSKNQMASEAIGNGHSSPLLPNDNLLSSLKSEVERALSCLQHKNEQLRKLQTSYQTAQNKMKQLQAATESSKCSYLQSQVKVTSLMKELQEIKERLQNDDNKEEISALKKENLSLKIEFNKGKQRIEELYTSNNQLKEEICSLKDEMTNLVQTHDYEQQKAVNDCRDACIQLHDDATRVSRDEMERHLVEIQRNNQKLVGDLTQQLDDVKALYVKVCEEKNQLENDLLATWNEAKKKEIDELKRMWASEMEEKVKLVKDKHSQNVNEEEFFKKVKAEVDKQTHERLMKCKVLWEKEQQLIVEEKASAKAKELIQIQQAEQSNVDAENAIDNYLEQIEILENRVKQTEDLYKQHLADLEMKMNRNKAEDLRKLEDRLTNETAVKLKELQIRNENKLATTVNDMQFKFHKERQKFLSDMKLVNESKVVESLRKQMETVDLTTKQQLNDLVGKIEEEKSKAVKDTLLKAEEDKRRALAEEILRKDLLHQDKLQAMIHQKDKEKEEALIQLEQKLSTELESFLNIQKQRFLMALEAMQESHSKEKDELQNSYETKISQLREEYKTHMESQQQEHLVQSQHMKSDASKENNKQQSNIKLLEDKCQQIERDMQQVVNDLKKQLMLKDVELESQFRKLNDYQEKLTKFQEDCSSLDLKMEIATLKIQVSKAEEEADHSKVKVEEAESNYQKLVLKHSNLKEKVKKYHRYIHGKEKEFAVSLTKITEEHKSALEKVFSMKAEVLILLEHKLEELRRHLFQTVSTADIAAQSSPHLQHSHPSKSCSEQNKTEGPDCDNGIALLKENFAQSIKSIHADIMSYLEDCSLFATAKIQEEVAKASWLLSEHLGMPAAKEPIVETKTSLKQTPVMSRDCVTSIGSRSRTPTPDLVTNYSSGRGTMVGNPSSLLGTTESTRNIETQTLTAEEPYAANFKHLKFWSSTPFTREFLDGTSVPLHDRPTPGLSKSSPVIPRAETFTCETAKGVSSEKLPFSNFLSTIAPPTLTFSNVTWKSAENVGSHSNKSTFPEKLHSADKSAKLHSLAHQILSQSVQNNSPVTTVPPGSEERKSRYVAFNNNLSLLKHDFWHSYSDAGTKEGQLDRTKKNCSGYE